MGKDLIIASAVGDLQWIRLCIDKGASPTYINEEVCTVNNYLGCYNIIITAALLHYFCIVLLI